MLKTASFVIIAVLLFSALQCANGQFFDDPSRYRRPNQINDPSAVTSLMLSQVWPSAACIALNQDYLPGDSSCSICRLPSSNEWTMHGLWGAGVNGSTDFCATQKYQPSEIAREVKALMYQKWQSNKLGSSNEKFWKHEYDKHGSCTLGLPGFNTQTDYFVRGLELLERYNLAGILAEAGIHPGRSYDYHVVRSAIANKLKTRFQMQCHTPKESSEQYINEVRICFDMSLRLIDCPTGPGSCKANRGKVNYPAIRKHCRA